VGDLLNGAAKQADADTTAIATTKKDDFSADLTRGKLLAWIAVVLVFVGAMLELIATTEVLTRSSCPDHGVGVL
jgi:hypothetical protein